MFKVQYVYELVNRLSPELKKIQSDLEAVSNKTQNITQSMSNSFSNVGNSLTRTSRSIKEAGSTLAPLSVAMGLTGTKAITSAANFETLGIQLEILTGSAEKGKNLFQELAKYSAETPFELPDIVQATTTLLGSNIALKDVVATTKMLGDVSAGSGADIKSLAVVYGQVAGMTKLQGQDAMQFVSNRIPIWALLQKSTGKSIDQLRELASDGKISFEMVKKALTQATQESGMYYKATEKLSKSLGGVYSTLKDNVNIGFGELGAEMVKSINLKELMISISNLAGKLTESFKSLSPETKKFITYGILITTVLAPVLLAFGSLVAVIGLAFSGFGLFGTAILGVITNLKLLATVMGANPVWATFILASTLIITYWQEITTVFQTAYDWLSKIVSKLDIVGKIKGFFGFSKPTLNLPTIETNQTISPMINERSQTLNQSPILNAGGRLDVNIRGLPKGSNTEFTPIKKNFLDVGVNSLFAQ